MKTHEHTYYYTGVLGTMEETFNNLSFETMFDFRMFFSFVQLRTRLWFYTKTRSCGPRLISCVGSHVISYHSLRKLQFSFPRFRELECFLWIRIKYVVLSFRPLKSILPPLRHFFNTDSVLTIDEQ